MTKKITEIFKSFKIAYDPNSNQINLAAERINICNACEFKKDIPIVYCSVCGCTLSKKIYSPVKGACPKGFWNDVDAKLL